MLILPVNRDTRPARTFSIKWVIKRSFVLIPLCGLCIWASGQQIQHTSIPIGNAAAKALEVGSLTGKSAKPFHIRMVVSEPENPQSPYQGTIEEWWASPQDWRRVVTSKEGMRQTVVSIQDKKTESDQGDYFPLWLRSFVTGLFEPIPDAAAWTASGMTIDQITMPNGAKSDACARARFKIGSGDQATDAFANLCFDGEGRLKFYGSPRYSMEFHDYGRFGKKQIARKLIANPEPGTTLVGQVEVLEEQNTSDPALFTPLPTNDDLFASALVTSAQMDALASENQPIIWPPVHSGNIKGHLAIYISADRNGHVREAWPLNSDNAGLEDPAREQVRKWTLKAAVDHSGNRVQVDGGLGFIFSSSIEDALPQLTNEEVRKLATKIIEPAWPAGSVHSGDVIQAEVSVNEQGKLAGMGFTKTPTGVQGAVINALQQWTFLPLIRDGKPQYFHGTVQFRVE
jgi:hypothetical protein